MRRLLALLAPLTLALAALPAQAEKIPLATLSAYLNGLGAAQSSFVQINADGSSSTGMLYLQRPGRMRFEYAPPDANLVLASAGQVAIFDAKSNEPPEQYPLARTPLNLVLGREIDLDSAGMVAGHTEVEGATIVRAQDPDHPEYGGIDLYFTAEPLRLVRWVITDDLGQQTTILLDMLTAVDGFGPTFFSLESEKRKRGF
ncbi:MAG: LolA family protein [Paracoccaceae bacterium]